MLTAPPLLSARLDRRARAALVPGTALAPGLRMLSARLLDVSANNQEEKEL